MLIEMNRLVHARWIVVMPRTCMAFLLREHVMAGPKLHQIGLDQVVGWRGLTGHPRRHSIRYNCTFNFTLLSTSPVRNTYQHTSFHRHIPPTQHGSPQAYHQGDGAPHGRAVCLSYWSIILVHHIHTLTPSDSVPGIEAIPHEDNLRYFDVKIHGPSQSPYEGA